MAKKEKPSEKKPREKPTPKDASSGIDKRLKDPKTPPPFQPNKTETAVIKYVERRTQEMMDYRKSLNLEPRWKQADEEYVPHELDFGTTRKRFETDQDTGLRSRMVPVGDASQQWRQASSAPTLLSKIQTAVSIIIDNQPEADLVPLLKKYKATTDLAYALWKRNWSITDSKEKLKLIVFNLIKYGWAPQRTYPRTVKYPKHILTEKDPENPENDKYEESEIEWFNDVDREPLNPFRTWVDEMSKPYDPYSTNECYFEVDYSYDAFMVEFGKYPNSEFVHKDSAMNRDDQQAGDTNRQTVSRSQSVDTANKSRSDIVTVGFFESRTKDLYTLYIPKHKIVLYQSPMPNDDGYLSVTHTLWILRSANLPYGISLWDIIRQNKALYDKMKNMGMDQLVLSIMKFGFFSGTSTALGDGKIDIVPGQARQLTTSSGSAKQAVDWMEIPGPGDEFWRGVEAVSQMMDDESGISPTLEGAQTPGQQTLGEILHAKEGALKRLKVPVENIAWLLDQDAQLTLSWMSQVYAIPTIKTFADEKEVMAYEKENDIQHTQLFGQKQADGSFKGPFEGHYLPQLALHLENNEGNLTASKESQFFQVGKDIQPIQLKWKGIFKVIPRSIIDSSETLTKASKTELSNMLIPLFQFPPELVARAASQLCEINEEDPEDWLPQSFVDYLANPDAAKARPPDTIPQGATPPAGAPPAPAASAGGPGAPAQPETMQSAAGMTPLAPQTVVPASQAAGPLGAGKAAGLFNRRL